jgi:hypothetical protein
MHASPQQTVQGTLARMDEGWTAFRGQVHSLPGELLEVRLGEGTWTRKQMLAHIGTWHDLTVDRLSRFTESGEPVELSDETDVINARSARAAGGRTTGEILLSIDDSYRRLRRQVGLLTDAQLLTYEGWAGAVIAANTYDHYGEHLADLDAKGA